MVPTTIPVVALTRRTLGKLAASFFPHCAAFASSKARPQMSTKPMGSLVVNLQISEGDPSPSVSAGLPFPSALPPLCFDRLQARSIQTQEES
jgi:hypothetical protein